MRDVDPSKFATSFTISKAEVNEAAKRRRDDYRFQVGDPSLTDEQVDTALKSLTYDHLGATLDALGEHCARPCNPCEDCETKLLRLRSDEWLEKAAEEIHAERHDDGYGPSLDQIRAILRKHRDGK